MSHQTSTYLKALAEISELTRIHQLGTVCENCGTAYVPNPKSTERPGTCGLCKVKLTSQ